MDQATKTLIEAGLRKQERKGRVATGTTATWVQNQTKRPADRTATPAAEVKRLKAKVNRHVGRQNEALAFLIRAKSERGGRAQALVTKAIRLLAQ